MFRFAKLLDEAPLRFSVPPLTVRVEVPLPLKVPPDRFAVPPLKFALLLTISAPALAFMLKLPAVTVRLFVVRLAAALMLMLLAAEFRFSVLLTVRLLPA